MRHIHSALALAALPFLATSASADVVEISASKDNSIYGENAALANGSGDYLFSGQTAQANTRRALIAFDVASAIPAGATINSVTLTLHCSQTISSTHNVGLYRLLADWGEEGSDAPGQEGGGTAALPGDATWSDNFFTFSTWSTPGGDAAATASAITPVTNSFTMYDWSGSGMVADVQDMLDNPGSNFGWLIRHVNESGAVTAKRFDSRSNFDPSFRPKLTVDFDSGGGGCSSSTFCSSDVNSTGGAALISFSGSCVVSDNAFTLEAAPVPNQPGIFYYGLNQLNGGNGVAFGNGTRCVGGMGSSIYRLPPSFASGNAFSYTADLTNPPGAAGLITTGSTWNFQCWFRDPAAGGAGFDLSDGLEVTFQ